MKTKPSKSSYRRAFLIETTVGGILLLASLLAYSMEQRSPELRGSLVWGFMFPAVINLFLASLHYTRYRFAILEESIRQCLAGGCADR